MKFLLPVVLLIGVAQAQSPQKWEKFLLVERADQTSFGLCRASLFAKDIKKIFREEEVPEKLMWLALIESSFRPFAVSKSNAVGLFQFKKQTAVHFGLRVSKGRDERTFPLLSARASAKYLKYLYVKFQDWDLALAAYNVGEGTLRRTMQRTSTKNWIQVKVYLRQETKEYVPKVHAAARIGENYLLKHKEPRCFLYTVNKGDTLFGVSDRNHVELLELRRLNGLKGNQLQIGQTLIIPLISDHKTGH